MHGIPRAPGCRAYSSVGREVGAVCVERLAVFVPSLPHPLLSTVYQCDGCLSYLGSGGSWLGCQVWPVISAVSILELVANSGSSRMSQAPNLHSLRATKLFISDVNLYGFFFLCFMFIRLVNLSLARMESFLRQLYLVSSEKLKQEVMALMNKMRV